MISSCIEGKENQGRQKVNLLFNSGEAVAADSAVILMLIMFQTSRQVKEYLQTQVTGALEGSRV